ncbi:DapH/DapD/GlmU-related protein [Flavobacterium sp. ov086]|uniref:acyltransferase n=1 Tax=Flavobacterium sp. ov086 TaxID=1761785 RepID=UPI000B6DBF8C|nr:acyltransferase [Flavobacterium sp. ov086]SNR49489.1 Acetyltransferase (isoleucine patch superfamily) [Flavobacterium sp. ov086]
MDRIFNFLVRRFWYFNNKGKFRKLGNNVFIKNSMIITPKYISVGDNVFVQPNSRIEAVTSYEGVKYSPHIVISDNCTIQQNLHLTCAVSIFLGKNTAIAANVTITDIDHPYENINLPVERQSLRVNPVSIGEDCKIYNNAVILPGTQIGKHCVVGANSVVFGTFGDYCILVGSPAKIIKRYCFDSSAWRKTDDKGNFVA